jgi:hypothetical membrane protein
MTPGDGRALLWAAVAVPIVYFGTVVVAALFYPGYSHVTQYASELGSASAPHPMIFNTGAIATGVLAILAALGLRAGTVAAGGSRILAELGAIAIFALGVSLLFGGIYPMPDPRHGGYGLGMAVQVAPFLFAAALWKQPALRGLNRFLIADGVLMLGFLAIMMGVGGLVTRSNVGLWQRAYALTVFPWVGILGYRLR